MTEHVANKIVDRIAFLKTQKYNDDEIVLKLIEDYGGKEEQFQWIVEMANTGALRATIMSNGLAYPKSNISIEDDAILSAAFKRKWIELKGEDDYLKNYIGKKKG